MTPTLACLLLPVGRVIKIGADYIGLLVLGVFNASIAAEHIRKEFRCHRQVSPHTWAHGHTHMHAGMYACTHARAPICGSSKCCRS